MYTYGCSTAMLMRDCSKSPYSYLAKLSLGNSNNNQSSLLPCSNVILNTQSVRNTCKGHMFYVPAHSGRLHHYAFFVSVLFNVTQCTVTQCTPEASQVAMHLLAD